MVKNRLNRWAFALATAFVLVLTPALALAADQDQGQSTMAQKTTLSGKLSTDTSGGYVLVESKSGDSIAVKGPKDLAAHVGESVRVTGDWKTDADGNKYFEVTKVEKEG